MLSAIEKKYLQNKVVVDVGAGSGILSIAATKKGAGRVYALEIDPESILHAYQNIILNRCEKTCFLSGDAMETSSFLQGTRYTVLINMTYLEQVTCIESVKEIFTQAEQIIAYGILDFQKIITLIS